MAKRKHIVITKEVLAAALSLNAAKAARARADKLNPERRREIAAMGGAAYREKMAKLRKAKTEGR